MLYAIYGCSIFLSFSLILLSSGLNQVWMSAIHSNPYMPEWIWAILNLGGDAWVVLLILLCLEAKPSFNTSWSLKTWILGAFAVQLIKQVLPMPRPANVIGLEHLTLIDHPPLMSGSMPSGHALAAMSCGLIVCAVLKKRCASPIWLAFVLFIAILVAWSRVAVGAHWPADVIAGIGLSILIVCLAYVWDVRGPWHVWLEKPVGGTFLIILHIFIAWHLTVPQSDFALIQFVQLNLALISLMKALDLIRRNFFVHLQ